MRAKKNIIVPFKKARAFYCKEEIVFIIIERKQL